MRVKLNDCANKRVGKGFGGDDNLEKLAEVDSLFSNAINGFGETEVREGIVVPGLIQGINKDYVLVCVGSKSEGKISRREFSQDLGAPELKVGSCVNVFLEKMENKAGVIVLSREKALRYEMWDRLEKLYENGEEVEGTVTTSIKSGCIVDLGNILAFLPGSHVDVKVVKDLSQFIGKKFNFKILKMDKKQGNIVVSRRSVLNSVNAVAREQFLDTLKVGQIVEGSVKSITHYGLFVGVHESNEVGVVDGLVHITDISWSRVSHPSAFYSYGQRIKVKIIKIDKETGRISLGIKQLESNPWDQVEKDFPVGMVTDGSITSVEEYGVFVELAPGIEGLVHLSEISWVRSNRPFSRGQEVRVKVVAVDSMKCRMSLSIKQCQDNPWQKFVDSHSLGTKINCIVKNVVDSGVVVSFLEPEFKILEGFIRNSDVCDDPSQIKTAKRVRPGDELAVKILQVNPHKGSISLGIRQLTYDPFEKFLSVVKVGDVIDAVVSKIDGRGVQLRVTNDIVVYIPQESVGELSALVVEQSYQFIITVVGKYSLELKLVSDNGVGGDQH